MKQDKMVKVMTVFALSLFVLVPSAHAENRTVKVTVSVTAKEEAVVDANVTLTPDTGAPAVNAKTGKDGNAVVSVPIGPAGWFSSAAAIKITAEKDSQTASETIKLRGKDFNAGAVPEVIRTLALNPPGVVPGGKTIELTVAVVGPDGNAARMARVNIYQGKWAGTVVAPPMLQRETDTNGVAQFPIQVAPGQTLSFSIEVGREDMQSEVRNIDIGTKSETEMLEQFFLKARPKVGGTGDKDVITVAIDVQNDQSGNIEGAKVVIFDKFLGSGSGHFQGVTAGDGRAVIPVWWASANAEQGYELTVSKSGYRDLKSSIQLNKEQVGKTIRGAGVTLERIGPGTIKTVVTVLDTKTGQGVGEAKVVLDGGGGSYYPDTTNGSGNVTFYVSKAGGFTVRISHDNYFPFTGEARLLKDQPETPLEFKLEPKANKDLGEDTIEVTVLGKDSTDEKSKPAPIKGAYAKAGTISAETDESGVATLTAAFAETQEVTVQANGYKTKTQSVRVNKGMAHMSAGSGKTTFTLDPELSETSPIRLRIEVRDASGKAVPKAHVDIETTGGEVLAGGPADDDGNFKFNSAEFDKEPSALRPGLKVAVKFHGFKDQESSIGPELLKPSTETRRFSVQLDNDWTDLITALTALEQKVAAWQKDRGTVSQTAESDLVDKARAAQKHAAQILKEIEAAKDAFGITFSPGGPDLQRCRKAKELKEDVQLCEAKANQKAEELKRLLDAASASAANCSAEGDPDIIKKDYSDATKLLIEIGALNKKAGKDRDELAKLAAESSAGKKLLADMNAKLAEIGDDKKTADETVTKAAALYARFNAMVKGFAARRLQLYSEFGDFKSNYHVVEVSLPPNLQTRIQAVENALNPRDSVPDTPKPKTVPESVSGAPGVIANLQGRAEQFVNRYRSAACEVDTMDEVVDGIYKTFTDASFEIGLAADLPKQADDCAKKIADAANQVEVPDLSKLNDLEAMTRAADQVGMKFHAVATSATPPPKSQRLFGPQDPPAKTKAKRGDPLTIIVYQKLAEKNATPAPTQIVVSSPTPSASPSPDNDDIVVPDVSKFKDPDAMLAGAGPDMVGMLIAVRNAPPPGTTTLFSHQDPAPNTKSKRGKPLTIYIYQSLAEATTVTSTSPTPTPDTAIAGTMPDLGKLTIDQAVARLPSNMSIGGVEVGGKPPKCCPELALTIYGQYPPAGHSIPPDKITVVTVTAYGEAESAVAASTPEPASDSQSDSSPKSGPTDITNTTGGEFWKGTPPPAKKSTPVRKATPAPNKKKKTSDWWRQHGHDRPDYEVPNN